MILLARGPGQMASCSRIPPPRSDEILELLNSNFHTHVQDRFFPPSDIILSGTRSCRVLSSNLMAELHFKTSQLFSHPLEDSFRKPKRESVPARAGGVGKRPTNALRVTERGSPRHGRWADRWLMKSGSVLQKK